MGSAASVPRRCLPCVEDTDRTELQVINGALNLVLGDRAIESPMRRMTSGLLYGFTVCGSRQGQVHHWAELG